MFFQKFHASVSILSSSLLGDITGMTGSRHAGLFYVRPVSSGGETIVTYKSSYKIWETNFALDEIFPRHGSCTVEEGLQRQRGTPVLTVLAMVERESCFNTN